MNNFSDTLQNTIFCYNDSYGLPKERFDKYLLDIRHNVIPESTLLTTEFSYLRYRIHEQCHQLATAKPDGIQFMQWLKENNWKIVICTHRDLRMSSAYTEKWLKANEIPYDYLFTALNKIVFCNLWEIPHLIDDADFNILYGEQYGVNVYYPIMEKHTSIPQNAAKGFYTFDEVKQWIQE
ncbi:hypothetical protein Ga0466249_001574 [Sporomusaceae bacterium BoRhaA]|uniref:hypothetical protein n=1 Tax=Pelorhabdus rhamnosifermentans TaxID=2772457 RepID=UPI001C061866|nr:hypothetical protein [Pelorhabdus rhamnosifermentans]MBU2700482.1 hypothetical protein [Pelorhabdus rhamnosifermentans]